MPPRPLIAHVIHRLSTGGLENGLVNIINGLPESKYRHAVICLTESTAFRQRLRRSDVEIVELHKQPGKDPKIYARLWSAFKRLKPQLVHSRNIATLDAQFIALLAGVPHRLHGEHGRDIYDLDGSNQKYRWLRQIMNPIITAWVPMSMDLMHWLEHDVGIKPSKIKQIYNGVDTQRFSPLEASSPPFPVTEFRGSQCFLVGSVGRMEPVKDPLNLIRAFLRLRESSPHAHEHMRLAYIGGGSLLEQARDMLKAEGAESAAWLPGDRTDVAELIRHFDLFVLPSLAEGISNTILEAMACRLPVIATNVGGNLELIQTHTGALVPAEDPDRLAQQITIYFDSPQLRTEHGNAALQRIREHFSMDNMLGRYQDLYDSYLISSPTNPGGL